MQVDGFRRESDLLKGLEGRNARQIPANVAFLDLTDTSFAQFLDHLAGILDGITRHSSNNEFCGLVGTVWIGDKCRKVSKRTALHLLGNGSNLLDADFLEPGGNLLIPADIEHRPAVLQTVLRSKLGLPTNFVTQFLLHKPVHQGRRSGSGTLIVEFGWQNSNLRTLK